MEDMNRFEALNCLGKQSGAGIRWIESWRVGNKSHMAKEKLEDPKALTKYV